MSFEDYVNIKDKYDSLYTVIIYNTPKNKLIDLINHKLEKIKLMANSFKRKYLNDRLYLFREYVNTMKEKHRILLVGKEIIEIPSHRVISPK